MLPFAPSQLAARVARASRRPTRSPGPGVISLAMGEPDFDTPESVTAAGIEALRSGYTHYIDFMGDPESRQVLAAMLSEEAGVPFGTDQVLMTHGGTAGLAAAVLATINPNDRVVIPEPTYSLYADLVQLAGGEIVHVPTHEDHHLDLERLRAALPGARLLTLCHPNNPTGAVYRRDELEAIALMLQGSDTLVIADEAYNSIVYEGHPFVSALKIESLLDRLIYLQTFSKTYAMTGWRVGYAAGPPEAIKAITTVHRTFNGTPNAAVQRAALEAARRGPALGAPMLEQYTLRRTYAVKAINAIEGLHARAPEGTFYMFVRYDLDMPASVLLDRLMDGGVAVRAGTEYGPSGEHHFRISFATSMANLEEGFARLERTMQRLIRDQRVSA